MTEIATSDTIGFFLFFFWHLYIWPCIGVLCLQISDQRYKGFKCKNRWKCCIVDIAKKKKRRKYDCNTLSGKHVFDLHSAWKDILRWNLSYKRLIRSSLATLLWEAFHCICLVLNPYTDLYIPSHLSSGTGSCMYFKKGQVTVYMMLVYFLRCERLKCS